jgi:hypothetical protein
MLETATFNGILIVAYDPDVLITIVTRTTEVTPKRLHNGRPSPHRGRSCLSATSRLSTQQVLSPVSAIRKQSLLSGALTVTNGVMQYRSSGFEEVNSRSSSQ